MQVASLSARRTARLYAPVNIPGTHFCQRLSRSQGHSAAGRIMSMKNSNYTNGNRTSDLPACSAVPPKNSYISYIYINQLMQTLRNKSHESLRKLVHFSAPSCHILGVTNTKKYKHQHTNLASNGVSL
jgi:hypothetical protein